MFLNKLYKEGLMDQEIFTHKAPDFIAKAAQGRVASFNFINNGVTSTLVDEYEGVPVALKGPKGDQIWSATLPMARNIGAFVLTSECKNPEAMVRWVDYFYGEEGSKLYFMGKEGETYEYNEEEQKYEYVDEIANNPNGLTFDQSVGQVVPWSGQGGPAHATAKVFSGAAVNPGSLDAAKKLEPYCIEPWNAPIYTLDEQEQIKALNQQLNPYIDQMTSEFVIGKRPFTDGEKYIKTLNQMGLQDYIAISQAAIDRMLAQ